VSDDRLYGRRIGKPLSPRRAALMADAYPRLVIDVAAPTLTDIAGLFSDRPAAVQVEIGFGGGEHLVAEASRAPERGFPDRGFIGVEPFVNGMAKAVAAIADGSLANVRLFGGDAARLLDWLPAHSVDTVDLLYPDPWPKKRHWKRRFVSPENLDRIARVLKPGGTFRFASDIPGYVEWTLAHVVKRADFTWTAERAADWTEPFPGWPGTRYEAKALAAGRVPTYLAFLRRDAR
jgi:tRNA (guanine-N7-)-methyltransferase